EPAILLGGQTARRRASCIASSSSGLVHRCARDCTTLWRRGGLASNGRRGDTRAEDRTASRQLVARRVASQPAAKEPASGEEDQLPGRPAPPARAPRLPSSSRSA